MAKSTSDDGRWLSIALFAKTRLVLKDASRWGHVGPNSTRPVNLLHDQETIMPSLPVTIPFAVVFAIWIIEIHAK